MGGKKEGEVERTKGLQCSRDMLWSRPGSHWVRCYGIIPEQRDPRNVATHLLHHGETGLKMTTFPVDGHEEV